MSKSSAKKRQFKRASEFMRAVESLESRWLLSGTADLDPVTHVLTVDGDGGDNVIVFSESAGVIHVTIDGSEPDPSGYSDVSSVLVHGFDGSDTIDLGNITQNAYVRGGAGDDTITSGQGDDTLSGEGGDDQYVFNDDWGSDIIDEAQDGGNDTMDFSACTGNLFVTIGALSVSEGNNVANHAGSNIENIIGGAGNDTFHFLNGEGLTGTLDGGSGINSLDYGAYAADHSIDVNLESGDATGTAGISNMSNVVGGAGNDSITGDSGDNFIDGGAGDDALDGGGGTDSFAFDTGAGHDTITEPLGAHASYDFSTYATPLTFNINTNGVNVSSNGQVIASGISGLDSLGGGLADDQFIFQKGASFAGHIDGGAGVNTIDYRAYTTPVNVSLMAGTATGTTGISHMANIYGGAGNDTLTGDNNVNRIFGSAGNDKLYGMGGNDYIDAGTGNDIAYGGDGNDTIHGGNNNDKLYGDAGNDKLYGGSGNDTLTGGAGGDYLSGDAGNDLIYSRDKVRDTVVGGSGTDKAKVDAKKLDKVLKISVFIK